jgi:hypothetical protein
MTRRTRRTGPLLRAVGAVVLLAGATACTSNVGADRSGGQVVGLSFATVDGDVKGYGGVGPGIFVEQLEKVSGGRLRVDVSTSYGDGAGDAESRLLRSIAVGKVDGGWPATRAFANAGIDGIRAVEAPMVLTSYAAVRDLVQGPASTILLGRLDDTGVVDLGLVVGPLRAAVHHEVAPVGAWRTGEGSLPGLPLTGAGGHRPLPRRLCRWTSALSGSTESGPAPCAAGSSTCRTTRTTASVPRRGTSPAMSSSGPRWRS